MLNLNRKIPTCIAPFISFYINSFRIGVCCEYAEVTNLPTDNCEDSWNNKEFIHYRKVHHAGIFDNLPDVCKTCIKSPTSHSQHFFRSYMDDFYDIIEDYNVETGEIPYSSIREFTIGTSNKCNLACITCGSVHSHTRARLYGELPKNIIVSDKKNIIEEKYQSLEFLELVAPYLKVLVIHGGEPTMENKSYDIINIIKKYNKKMHVNYLSNGTLTKFPNGVKLTDALKDLPNLLLTVSLDALDKALNYIRYPCKENKIISFLEDIERDLPKATLAIHMTVSNLSLITLIETIKGLIKLSKNKNIRIDIFSIALVFRPVYYHPNVLPMDIKKKILKDMTDYIEINNTHGWPDWLNVDTLISVLKSININEFDKKLWKEFIAYQKQLDEKRNLNINEIFPSLISYLKNETISLPSPS